MEEIHPASRAPSPSISTPLPTRPKPGNGSARSIESNDNSSNPDLTSLRGSVSHRYGPQPRRNGRQQSQASEQLHLDCGEANIDNPEVESSEEVDFESRGDQAARALE